MSRRKILFVITFLTFPLIIFNLLAAIVTPFLQFWNYDFAVTLIKIELCIWGLVILPAIFIQRWHCSHNCAMTGIFEIISVVTKSKDIMRTEYPKATKYVVLFLWNGSFAFIIMNLFLHYFTQVNVAPIYLNPYVILYYSLFFLSGILSLTLGKSSTAHYICPLAPWTLSAIRLGKKLHIPTYSVVTNADLCVQCKQCNKTCMMGEDVCQKVKENHFDQTKCMNCMDCAKSCKTGAIRKEWIKP